jgi:transposase
VRSSQTTWKILPFLKSIPEALKATVKTVCTDMYQGYVKAVAEALPQAKIVVDRFHIAQVYRKSADAVRKRELRRLKRELPEPKYALLKGLMLPRRTETIAALCRHSWSPIIHTPTVIALS